MHAIKLIQIILAIAAATIAVVHAHTQVFNAGVDGALGANFQYLIENNFNNVAIENLTSTDLRCRSMSDITGNGVDKLGIDAGETLTIRWDHSNNTVVLAVLPESHKGPCMVYMAPLSSQGDGDVWFKIYEDGYDMQKHQWCSDKLISSWGIMNVTMPKDIPNGDYLVRAEVLALHQIPGIGFTQFYPNCVVVTVSGGTVSTMPKGYAIPGIYAYQDPGIYFSRRDNPADYQIPGPAVIS
ncbi:hypothetical protein EV175_004142 [Coemansia sp. RSA 1933]|nr:hypothetical protein EV175_004142 [Coemansia sp. RSA 1933]